MRKNVHVELIEDREDEEGWEELIEDCLNDGTNHKTVIIDKNAGGKKIRSKITHFFIGFLFCFFWFFFGVISSPGILELLVWSEIFLPSWGVSRYSNTCKMVWIALSIFIYMQKNATIAPKVIPTLNQNDEWYMTVINNIDINNLCMDTWWSNKLAPSGHNATLWLFIQWGITFGTQKHGNTDHIMFDKVFP